MLDDIYYCLFYFGDRPAPCRIRAFRLPMKLLGDAFFVYKNMNVASENADFLRSDMIQDSCLVKDKFGFERTPIINIEEFQDWYNNQFAIWKSEQRLAKILGH